MRVGSPVLVGVRNLDAGLLAAKRFGDNPPLVAVEAEGYTERGAVDVERGIVQAYDRSTKRTPRSSPSRCGRFRGPTEPSRAS